MEKTVELKRVTKPFRVKRDKINYFLMLSIFSILAALAAIGLILYKNPVPVSSPSFKPVLKRRMVAVVAMAIASICQSFATIPFQTVTNNRLITPSILGFEALYSLIHTSIIFFLGVSALQSFSGPVPFYIQVALMSIMSLMLYGWLLGGKRKSVDILLLVGVVFGIGLKSVGSFMRRLLTPSEFDVLQARLFASVNNADSRYFPVAIPLVLVAIVLIFLSANKLNLITLGRDTSINLGENHKRLTKYILTLTSVLISISTALVGPLTFLGFLVSTITYQIVRTYDHRYILPIAAVLSFLILAGSYFFMYHVFNAQGVVSIIIELFGGVSFLILLFSKGNL